LDKVHARFAEISERNDPGWKNRYPAGLLDTLGAFVAVAGVVLMLGGVLFGGRSSGDDDEEQAVSVQGDLAALFGAAMMAVYLWAGRSVRPWMPIWLYALPVTVSAALFCMVFSGFQESASFDGHKEAGFFGWVYSSRLTGLTLGAAGISGILGHTLANYSLKHVPSLVVSVSILLETVIGSVIGWLAGVNESPDMWTWIGGAVLLVGGVMTIYGQDGHLKKRTMSRQRLTQNPDIPTGNDFIVELYGGAD
jgi:drug/metabolite transporter (DMT)-like permease